MAAQQQRFFEDTDHAIIYATYRPKAPQKLADRIVQHLKAKYKGSLSLCIDVGCGNGQCSDLFSADFDRILATDVSQAQIEAAQLLTHPPNVEFKASLAEYCPVESRSVQLVNSTQAVHWFDLPIFFKEVDRILCPGGILAVSGYFNPLLIHPTESENFEKALQKFNKQLTWGPGIEYLLNEYADIHLPYEDTVREEVWTDEERQTLAFFASDLSTSSGYCNLCREKGEAAGQELLQEFIKTVKEALGCEDQMPEEIILTIKRKYFLLMSRKPYAT